jgi:predicted enzyme related to lactoylglutathione lyase
MSDETLSRRDLLGSAAGIGVIALASGALAQPTAGGVATAGAVAGAPHFGFTKLMVGDLEKSAAFYQATCGLVEQTRVNTESAGRKLSEILFKPTAPGGATLVLIHYYDTPEPARGELILGFSTADIDAFVARALAAGGTVEQAPYAIPEMKIRVAFVRDVEGHRIEVVQPVA